MRVGGTVAATVLALALVGTAGGRPSTAVAEPAAAPASGGGTSGGVAGTQATAEVITGAAPKVFKTYQLRGGYVAAGVSLRNRGKGSIKISGIPSGAKVKAAYLLWSVLSASESSKLKKGKFAGKKITGTKVGSGDSPNWQGTTKGYSYRANVTKKVKKNGTYKLTGFASGTTNGADPFTTTSKAPLAEGASLVVVYSKSTYPMTKVVLANGYAAIPSGSLSMTVPFGFTAGNPVGAAQTTFIGGDGQSADEPPSMVNGVPLAAVTWDGNDGPTPRYSQGNLWDTTTVDLPNIVKPGDKNATVTVAGGPDYLVWTGQAFSIGVNGAADTDGDKLLDGWEANGYDANGDSVIDVNLPAMGASVVRKDLFVEMDFMSDALLPQVADLARIVKVFDTAPQAKNPNGQTGIKLHLDAGAARGSAYNLGGGNLVPFISDLNPVVTGFQNLKSANFNPRRAKIFYYMIWANGYNGGTSSGNAFNIPNDSFVVTLGKWPGGGTPDQRVGTFVHEFGHALGQTHGGNDHANYKPNYLSVMNYSYQLSGVQFTNGTKYFGYSSFAPPTLNELKLNEKKGLGTSKAKPYRAMWVCPNYQLVIGGRADKNVDWNCDGKISSKVSADVNGDGQRTKLGNLNNWGNIVYGGGAVGGGRTAVKQSTSVMKELTYEEHQRMHG